MEDLVIPDTTSLITAGKEYSLMVDHIKESLPAVMRDSQNFYKSSSQFKNVTLDVTDLTPMSSLKHILAVIEQTRMALEETNIKMRKSQIELAKKQAEHNLAIDGFDKDLLEVEMLELATQANNTANSVKGAVRKLSFFVTQYHAILAKMGKENITEEEFEKEESRYHIMTALKQALNAARTRGGVIDEGNHIYLFEMGINGAVAQAEVLAYLQMEERMLVNGETPTHAMTIKWLEACADKFADCGAIFAESRGFIPLDQMSLTKELPSGSS